MVGKENIEMMKNYLQLYKLHHQLTMENGVLLWNNRLIIPDKLKKSVLS